MECQHCGKHIDGRKRKYCSKGCGNKASAARCTRLCTKPGCDKPRRAKGMCATHYNRAIPKRYLTVEVECDACGKTCTKEKRKQRYSNVFCSTLCRDYWRYGPTCSKIPPNHWARWYGATCEWTYKPNRQQATYTVGACSECGITIVEPTYPTPSKYCTETCAKRVARRARRAREANAPGTYTYAEVMRQYRRQGQVCAYCTHPVTGALPEPDHVVPLSRGGSNGMDNIIACCHLCNSDKGDQTLEEWEAERALKGKEPRRVNIYGLNGYTHLVRREAKGTSVRQRVALAA